MIQVAKAWGMTAGHHDQLAEQVRRDGHCVVPGLFPKSLISEWHRASAPLLRAELGREGARRTRGPVTLPFVAPFADPFVLADPDIIAVVDRLVGPDTVMCRLAADLPLADAERQEPHREAPTLFPEWERETPPFLLAVSFPLVDVAEADGPLEVARGTHLLSSEEALGRIRRGEIPLERVAMQAGDVLIRDARQLHRGMREPRPMVVIGYSRHWLHHPEPIAIPRAAWENLSPDLRHLLRSNRVVDDPAEARLHDR